MKKELLLKYAETTTRKEIERAVDAISGKYKAIADVVLKNDHLGQPTEVHIEEKEPGCLRIIWKDLISVSDHPEHLYIPKGRKSDYEILEKELPPGKKFKRHFLFYGRYVVDAEKD